jgi:uncharacterized membrane protein
MFLEITIVNFAWFFNIHFPRLLLIVIWALGLSMVALAALIHLRTKIIVLLGILIVGGHNLLDHIHTPGNSVKSFIWAELHEQQSFKIGDHVLVTGYPVLAWIGIMALGYCFGSLYTKGVSIEKRKKWLFIIGGSAVGLFIILRALNVYGDPHPWVQQSHLSLTVISFFNTTKYPPSLLFVLMTLGPSILFLAFAENFKGKFFNPLIHIGRVPMFFYLLHLYLIHIGAMLAVQLTGFGWMSMILNGWPAIKGYGFSLAGTYIVWVIIVLILYPLCKWYDRYKTTHKEKWWLSYL